MIPASYVKWLEQAGIRVIPIRYDLKDSTVKKLMSLINGILITGGSASLFQDSDPLCQYKKLLNSDAVCPSQYMQKIHFIVQEAIRINDEDKFFPIWTTCLGYEALLISLSNYTIKRMPIYSENHSLNLNLEPSFVEVFSKYYDL